MQNETDNGARTDNGRGQHRRAIVMPTWPEVFELGAKWMIVGLIAAAPWTWVVIDYFQYRGTVNALVQYVNKQAAPQTRPATQQPNGQ